MTYVNDVEDLKLRKDFAVGEISPVGGLPKRVFDILFSVIALVTIAPVLLAIAAVGLFASSGPVFFRHRRVGKGGRTFNCIKFRTMHEDADKLLAEHLANNPDLREEFERDHKLKNDPRIIPVIGHFLRKTSLDELPQFWNVLRGDMSVVGPRPVTSGEIPKYGDTAAKVLTARPGITGIWQVSGRNDISFEDRVGLDVEYVENWSFRGDLEIVARTILVLFSRRGAY